MKSNTRSQAGFELMLSISFVLVVTSILSAALLSRQTEVTLRGRGVYVLNNCEEFVNLVVQVLKVNGLRAGFNNKYNLTIEGDERVITSLYDDGVIICHLTTKEVVNNAGYDSFNMSVGEYYLTNNQGVVRVEMV
jgi:hypothetical protein